MFFKNLQLYRFTRPFNTSSEQLEKLLESHLFVPCGSQELSKFGWISPMGKSSKTLVHEVTGQLFLCAKREEKQIPSDVIKDGLQEKIDQVESEQGRPLKKKEKEALKEELLHILLPRAFPRASLIFIWINTKDQYIVVDSSSAKKADDALSLLRKCTGSLPVIPLAMNTPPEITMTEWLSSGAVPSGFTLEDEAELRSALEHGGIVKTKEQNLVTDEIKGHLLADKLVTKLALNWRDSISFVIDDSLAMKRVKFSDELRERNEDISSEDMAARIDADFTLMAGELSDFISNLITAMGGEKSE